jgi:tetratricopeptide (TPR) repeat protein
MLPNVLAAALAAVLLAPPAEAPLTDAPRQDELLAEADALYARRDEPGALDACRARLEEAERRSPGSYDALWRLARVHFWMADDPGLKSEEKSRIGKIAWDYGDRATAANPGRVEGWHYAAAGVGNHALGMGIITAIRKGMEGKFKERLSTAERIDPDFERGGLQTAWGRFWFELPWPKYSPERAQKLLEQALGKNPDNVRARVYLADVHAKEGRADEAEAELRRALAHAPGRYDAPEERRWQEVARRKIAGR